MFSEPQMLVTYAFIALALVLAAVIHFFGLKEKEMPRAVYKAVPGVSTRRTFPYKYVEGSEGLVPFGEWIYFTAPYCISILYTILSLFISWFVKTTTTDMCFTLFPIALCTEWTIYILKCCWNTHQSERRESYGRHNYY